MRLEGGKVNEKMYSDVMTDTQASRFGGYSDGYNAGRKAERERCAKIAEGYFNARGRVVAKAIMGDMMQSEIDKRPYVHECGKTNYIFCPACVYAEGRKAAEKDFDRFFRLEEGAGD